MNSSSLITACFIVVLITSFLVAAANLNQATHNLYVEIPKLTCEHPVHFSMDYTDQPGGIVPIGDGFKLLTPSTLTADVCQSGTLKLDVQGELDNSIAPKLVATLNSKVLLNKDIPRREIIYLKVNKPGRVVLGYFNDSYRSEARVASFSEFQLNRGSCSTFKVHVPLESGGKFDAKLNSASLVFAVPMTISPCGAGQFRFRLTGHAAGGEMPYIKVSTDSQTPISLQANFNSRVVNVSTDGSDIKIIVSNPYFKFLGDRNLIIHSIVFTPSGI